MKASTFYLLNLGCAKNLVEGEHLAGLLMAAGYEAVIDPGLARILIVNTCGFIKPAVEEALDAVFELNDARKPYQFLAVVGCLPGRYGKKLAASLPEVDLFVAPGEMHRVVEHLTEPPPGRLAISPPRRIFTSQDPRIPATGPGWAYLRVADGCSNKCAFCTIPHIRGRLRSRKIEDILAEAEALAGLGVREINLVAQDLTAYGTDIYGKTALKRLIDELAEVDAIKWIRLLYLYPDSLGKNLIKAILGHKKVLNYFDLPLQHIADPVLKAMGRKKSGQELKELIASIRELDPPGHPAHHLDDRAPRRGPRRVRTIAGVRGRDQVRPPGLLRLSAGTGHQKRTPGGPQGGRRSKAHESDNGRTEKDKPAEPENPQGAKNPGAGLGTPPGKRTALARTYALPGPGCGRRGYNNQRKRRARRYRRSGHHQNPRI